MKKLLILVLISLVCLIVCWRHKMVILKQFRGHQKRDFKIFQEISTNLKSESHHEGK